MPLVPMSDVLGPAHGAGYAVGAFNVVDLEFLEGILDAACEQRSPVVLNVAEVHFPFIRLENVCAAVVTAAQGAPVPIALNLDHGLGLGAVVRALRAGFTSVMFDGSKLDYEDNRRRTSEIVALCHGVGVSVEAELGAVGGDEDGGLESQADPRLFTDPARAGTFVRETDVDALAVAIGNAHGKYKGMPRLDFERLAAIHDAARLPLVLHGGSGIPDDDLRRAIGLGVAKINVYTEMSQAARAAVTTFLARGTDRYHDYPAMMSAVREAVRTVVTRRMAVFGSVGHA